MSILDISARLCPMWPLCTTVSFLVSRYKERIRTRMIKNKKPGSTSKFLNTKDWTFVKDGLDDFRDGLPPPNHDGDIIQVACASLQQFTSCNQLTGVLKARFHSNGHPVCLGPDAVCVWFGVRPWSRGPRSTPNRSVVRAIPDYFGANQWCRTCIFLNDSTLLLAQNQASFWDGPYI